MRITVQDLFDKYDLERYLRTTTEVNIHDETIEERIAEEVDYAFSTQNLNRKDLVSNITSTVLEYLEGKSDVSRGNITLDEFANHDTIEIEEE